MTQRRQVGFIKNCNHTQSHFQDEPSEFSYFRIRPKHDEHEFSPYKFEEEDAPQLTNTVQVSRKPQPRPPLPQRLLEKVQSVSSLADRAKADRLYNKIQQNLARYEQKRSDNRNGLQENIGSIRNKMQKLDEVLKDLKAKKEPEGERRAASYQNKKRRFQEDSSSSSSSEEEEVLVTAVPSAKIPPKVYQNSHRQQQMAAVDHKHEELAYAEDEPVQNEEQLSDLNCFTSTTPHPPPQFQEANVITFNSRIKNQAPLQIIKYSSSSSQHSESEQTEQLSRDREYIQHQPDRPKPTAQREKVSRQFYKNKGGVCFDIDVKQFTASVTPAKEVTPVASQKRRKPADQRAELLRRREAAKAYDRVARRAVFSPQY